MKREKEIIRKKSRKYLEWLIKNEKEGKDDNRLFLQVLNEAYEAEMEAKVN